MARIIQDARLVPLSPTTDALLTARGSLILIQGRHVFRLDDREVKKLIAAFAARPGVEPEPEL